MALHWRRSRNLPEVLETCKLMHTLLLGYLERIDLIIKVLERVGMTMVAVIHFTFVLSAIGISLAERLTREKP